MAKAMWKDQVLAESENTVMVEGNHYFPRASVHMELLKPSDTHTDCPWKGTASYYTLEVSGARNPDAAWYYSDPLPAAIQIKDHIAFWKGVRVES
jgi:uncharacterized protein (DUF427 family)